MGYIVRMADGPLEGKYFTVADLHEITGVDDMKVPDEESSSADRYLAGAAVPLPEDGKQLFPGEDTCYEYHFEAAA